MYRFRLYSLGCFAIIGLSALLGSCGVKKAQQAPIPPPIVVDVPPAIPKPDPTPPEPTTRPKPDPRPLPPPANPPKKEPPVAVPPAPTIADKQTDIALMLPIMAQQYHEGMNTDSLSEKSKMALEFYQGFLCGLDHLRMQGIDLPVQVFDTENNPAKVSRLLADSLTMRHIDLIIGPINNSELKETAAYAKRQKIYNVSPLSPATQNTKENPYYIIASPPIETHCSAIYDYIQHSYAAKRIITVAGKRNNEQSLAALFSQRAAAKPENTMQVLPLSYKTGITSEADISAQMNLYERNIFVITDFADEALIVDLTNKLNSLRNRYDISIFGMPNWIDLPNLPLDELANLDFHYTTPFFDTRSPEIERFRQTFYAKYRHYPTETAARAYDIITYFGAMQDQYGRQAGGKLSDKGGLFSNFKFRPVAGKTNKAITEYIENKYINIIRFRSDYVLEKVN
jgi:ABC-type branched-subunit amino acid transport system substrate-binding protein